MPDSDALWERVANCDAEALDVSDCEDESDTLPVDDALRDDVRVGACDCELEAEEDWLRVLENEGV